MFFIFKERSILDVWGEETLMKFFGKLFGTSVLCLFLIDTAVALPQLSLDESSGVITDSRTGDEWLQWSLTTGKSISEALAEYEASGWSLATALDMSELYTSVGLSGATWDGSTAQYKQYEGGANGGLVDELVALFGVTDRREDIGVDGTMYEATIAQYGEVGLLAGAITSFAMLGAEGPVIFPSRMVLGFTESMLDSVRIDVEGMGVALIRTGGDTPPVGVDEPGTAVLFVFALAAVGALRRRVTIR